MQAQFTTYINELFKTSSLLETNIVSRVKSMEYRAEFLSLSYQGRERILSFASYHSYHKESVEVQSISGCKEVQLRVKCAQSEVAKIQATLREKKRTINHSCHKKGGRTQRDFLGSESELLSATRFLILPRINRDNCDFYRNDSAFSSP